MGQRRNSHRPSAVRDLRHRGLADDQGGVQQGTARSGDIVPVPEFGVRNGRQALAVCGALLLAVGLIFGQTVRYEFVNLDDNIYVYENPQVSRGLSTEGIAWAFTHSHFANWHPLTWISLMLDSQFYGLNAGGYHLTNVLLHAATAIPLFLVLWRMTSGFWPSALVAAIFAVHPLHVESVAWVTERKDVLSGLFFMLTLAAYAGYARRPFSLVRYLLVAFCFTLGLLAKQSLVTLPFVLLLLDYWPLKRFSSPRRLMVEKVPLFVLAGAFSLLTMWVASGAVLPFTRLPLGWRLGNAVLSYVAYLGQFFWPQGLAALYPRPELDLPCWKIGAALLVLLGITVMVCWEGRRRPYLLVGWLWYLGMLVPMIGLVQVGIGGMADRFTYLSQIGLYIALVWGAAELYPSWPLRRWAGGLASVAMLAVLMGCAWRQTSYWHDSETLWTHTLKCTSRNCVAHYNLGNTLAHHGRFDEAIDQYRQALKINPDDVQVHINLGAALQLRRKLDEAIAQYQRALEIEPGNVNGHGNLGKVFASRRRFDEAIAQFQQAVKLKPDNANVQMNLAWLRATCPQASLRNGAEAIEHAQRANQISAGRRPDILYALAAAYAEAGRFPEAVAAARKARELATQQNNRGVADASRAAIALYEAGKPYRQTRSTSGQ